MPPNYPNLTYQTWVDGVDPYAASPLNLIQQDIVALVADAQLGWLKSKVAWTYVSATTFTCPGDYTLVFHKDTKLFWTQTTGKYAYAVASSYSAGTGLTTVTIAAGSDYTIANAAITLPYYSYADNPQGFPDWFNWAAAPTGYSAVPTDVVYKFRISGKACFLSIREATNGTSDATTCTMTLPVAAATVANHMWAGPAAVIDNGTIQTGWGRAYILSAGTTITFGLLATGAVFTNSGGKRIGNCEMFYEI